MHARIAGSRHVTAGKEGSPAKQYGASANLVLHANGHAFLLSLVWGCTQLAGCEERGSPDQGPMTRTEVPQARTDEVLLPARRHGLYGFIDSTGTFIIQPQFTLASRFVNGLAVVGVGGFPAADHEIVALEVSPFWGSPRSETRLGAINKKGEFVVSPRYTCLSRPSDDGDAVAALSTSALPNIPSQRTCTDWAIVNVQGSVTPLKGVTTVQSVAGEYLAAQTGELKRVLRDHTYLDCDSPSARRQGQCVERSEKVYDWVDTRKTGLMSTDLTWLIEPQYETVVPMSDGLAMVATGWNTKIVNPRELSAASNAFERLEIRADPFEVGPKSHRREPQPNSSLTNSTASLMLLAHLLSDQHLTQRWTLRAIGHQS